MSTVVSQTVFDEGKAAKAAGRAYTDDPYRAGSQDSLDWLAGYTADEPEIGSSGENGALAASTVRPDQRQP